MQADNNELDALNKVRLETKKTNVKNSLSIMIAERLDNGGQGSLLTNLMLDNAADLKRLMEDNPDVFFESLIFDQVLEYKCMSVFYTSILSGFMRESGYENIKNSVLDRKMKVDGYMLKLLSTLKSFKHAGGQINPNGTQINIGVSNNIQTSDGVKQGE